MQHIWPIGGGKGGSGKSFLVSNLGVWLAMQGKKTLMVDVDLGAANLHTLVNIPYPEKCLSDFINKKVDTLDETIIETSTDNLYLISGANNNLDASNLVYSQKIRVLRAITKLPYEYILLDVGAGTSFNTIDFYMISDYGVFVSTPEPTSIENVYRLIRSVYFRKIRQMLNQQDFKSIIEQAGVLCKESSIDYLSAIPFLIKDREPETGKIIELMLQNIQYRLVLNQHRKRDNPNLGFLMCKMVKKYLGIKMEFVGNIHFDERIHDAVRKKVSFISRYPYTQAASDIRELCNKMLLISSQDSIAGDEHVQVHHL
ncbi:MAG: AAA family ATPase [Deltaproteobacteria bacterium]|nr:AAA family ATPase [Deltaproteobacteria bacterium]